MACCPQVNQSSHDLLLFILTADYSRRYLVLCHSLGGRLTIYTKYDRNPDHVSRLLTNILPQLVACFSQMFFTLLVPEFCAQPHDATVYASNVCDQSEYYLKVYAILLGDFSYFERKSFTSILSVILM